MFDSPPADPLTLFADWFDEARSAEPNDPNAMVVASVGEDGMPSARMVLLKDYDPQGFVFYTNYESRKGRQIQAHPQVALLFHWKSLRRQVRIEGAVSEVTPAEADAYFASRPRQSQIGAWASEQSRPLESRFALEKRVAAMAARYAIGGVPRPPHWSGFRVAPRLIEFWKDGAFRLHDRFVYHREGEGWRIERLYP
ncbi:Pyridoxamine 5'-phosphate oxidase [Tistlia consotensis]|uniref:Pyridoxine/pyridoxamine 5'-phosphate oxidase n=1 Tax=Tistlia consotensis USBA 355 TaxID=560819 RepID=A0A1Y6CMX5_9PROT|nr:pyridoxamine 5'-phosphate oxidase [Tistlia consotensis]SMF60797.1 Pyridoxamine 5'-phosphate oxidase [Tistlia consotensis USBA 355]SNR92678.1 Pyridoxamine 5'-phosphate oxidase [Tistlia consotensis]